jgi:glycosyltransferase involved in cell wall biosynthesis
VHLGFTIYGSLDNVSGGFFYDRNLVQYLKGQQDEVEVVSLPWRAYGLSLLDNFSGSRFRRLSGASWDVLLQDELLHPSLFLLNRRVRRRRRFPIVALVHHLRCREQRPAWQNLGYRVIEQFYLSSVDGFVCVSQTTRRDVENLVGLGKPVVIATPGGDGLPGAVSRQQIEARVAALGPLRIIFAGSLIPRKELHTLLAALARLPREDWQLTAAGSLTADPAYVKAIRRQLDQLGLAAQVTLLGNLSSEELAARLAASHVLAVPSSYEGFGIVYLEAMRFGVPAIASTAGAAHEIITPGRDGFLVPPGDAAALAAGLRPLAYDRARLLALSLAAQEKAASFPTWEQSAARVRSFLQNFKAS